MNTLLTFYNNKQMMADVRELFVSSLRELALEELMRNEDARYIAKAIESIDKSFELLETEFGKKKPTLDVNEAR